MRALVDRSIHAREGSAVLGLRHVRRQEMRDRLGRGITKGLPCRVYATSQGLLRFDVYLVREGARGGQPVPHHHWCGILSASTGAVQQPQGPMSSQGIATALYKQPQGPRSGQGIKLGLPKTKQS